MWSLSNGAQRRFGAGSREVIGAGVSCEAYQVWRTRYLQSGGAKKHGTKCRMRDLQKAAHLGFPWKRVLNPSTTIRCEPIAGGGPSCERPPPLLGKRWKAGALASGYISDSPASRWKAHASLVPGL